MATHSSSLAWEIPWREKPGGLQSLCACYIASVFAIPWTPALQAPLSMGFSRQEHWSGLPCPPPDPVIKPGASRMSPELAARFFTTVAAGKPKYTRSQTNQI